MRLISKTAAIALLLFALVPAVTAGAQDCATDPYCVDSGDVDSGGSDAGGGAEVDNGGGAPASSGRPAAAESDAPASAPSGGLPITGSDVIGMAVVGAVAIALGAVLVRRSKVSKRQAV